MDMVLQFLAQPATIAWIGILLVALIFALKPDWRKYEGLMINAVKVAEKMAGSGDERAVKALELFRENYERIFNKPPSEATVRLAALNMPTVHKEIEGSL